MVCGDDDSWISGITTYIPKEEGGGNGGNSNFEDDSFFPRFFKQTSWRKMLNL